jgi:Tfp pilus assembly protein PilX
MASILIALISMIVISLIVLGFAQVSQREQRATLDKVLSTQALYAAESGVNDAQEIIETDIADGNPVPDKTNCTQWPATVVNPPPSAINSNTDVDYTCLLVNPQPPSLVVNPITDQARILQLQAVNSGNYNNIVISWQNSTLTNQGGFSCNGTYNGNSTQFPPQTSWQCDAGVLRIDVVPFANPAAYFTTFLFPSAGGMNQAGMAPYSTTNNLGSVQRGFCNSGNDATAMPDRCNLEITNLHSLADGGGYYLRIEAIYGSQNVTISVPQAGTNITCATTGGSCSFYNLINDQVLVDSTGQAQDVLKRVQARVSINPLDQNVVPDDAIQSSYSICKQFLVTNDTGLGVSDPSGCSL